MKTLGERESAEHLEKLSEFREEMDMNWMILWHLNELGVVGAGPLNILSDEEEGRERTFWNVE